MKHKKILNLLNDVRDSRFVTKTGTLPMIIQMQNTPNLGSASLSCFP